MNYKLILCILALAFGPVCAVEASAAETQVTSSYSSREFYMDGYRYIYFKTVKAYYFTFEGDTMPKKVSVSIDIYKNVSTGEYAVYYNEAIFGLRVYKSDMRGYAYMCQILDRMVYFNIPR